MSEDLIREIFLFGEEAAMRERLTEFAEGGITTFVLSPFTTPGDMPRMIHALATARP